MCLVVTVCTTPPGSDPQAGMYGHGFMLLIKPFAPVDSLIMIIIIIIVYDIPIRAAHSFNSNLFSCKE